MFTKCLVILVLLVIENFSLSRTYVAYITDLPIEQNNSMSTLTYNQTEDADSTSETGFLTAENSIIQNNTLSTDVTTLSPSELNSETFQYKIDDAIKIEETTIDGLSPLDKLTTNEVFPTMINEVLESNFTNYYEATTIDLTDSTNASNDYLSSSSTNLDGTTIEYEMSSLFSTSISFSKTTNRISLESTKIISSDIENASSTLRAITNSLNKLVSLTSSQNTAHLTSTSFIASTKINLISSKLKIVTDVILTTISPSHVKSSSLLYNLSEKMVQNSTKLVGNGTRLKNLDIKSAIELDNKTSETTRTLKDYSNLSLTTQIASNETLEFKTNLKASKASLKKNNEIFLRIIIVINAYFLFSC